MVMIIFKYEAIFPHISSLHDIFPVTAKTNNYNIAHPIPRDASCTCSKNEEDKCV